MYPLRGMLVLHGPINNKLEVLRVILGLAGLLCPWDLQTDFLNNASCKATKLS